MAAKIVAAMRRSKVRPGELADRIGVTPQYVSYLRSGKRRPSLEMLGKIAKELGVEMGELL